MQRYNTAKKVSIIGMISNLFLLIIKFLVAFISHSQAMLADAFNSAGDIFSSLLTFIGNKIASRPWDKNHNLGYGKAEYIYSIFIAISMIYIGLNLFYMSFKSLFVTREYHFSIYLIIVCIITIIIKFILYLYTKKVGQKEHNLLIIANAIDHKNDCILTTGNLIATIFAMYNIFLVDSIIGIIISSWILYSGLKIFMEAYKILMDRSIDEETKEKVIEIIKKHPEVLKVNHINSTPIGYQFQVNLTIFVDGNMTTFESHKIANKIEKELTKLDIISLAVIHVNPM